jgi:phosphoglycerate dehydrogenase-like enzyme
MGIVGYGTVGRAVGERARAFGMRVLAVDVLPHVKADHGAHVAGGEGLDDLLSTSDYVVITVPYTAQTRGLIGERELRLMKPGAILVAVSRGGIIDQTALVEALTSGRLQAAALDVFETEPLTEHSPLWDLDNILITPHAAGGSQFEAPAVLAIFAENVRRYLVGDFPLRNEIGKKRGY